MLFVLHRKLAIPLWAVAFFTVAFTTPPTATLFLIPPATIFAVAAVGFAAIIFSVPGAITRWRESRSLVRVVPSEDPIRRVRQWWAASTGVSKALRVERDRSPRALDPIRIDDDGTAN